MPSREQWTIHEINLLRRVYPRGGARSACIVLNRTAEAIRRKASDLGVKMTMRIHKESAPALAALYPTGESDPAVMRDWSGADTCD
jgi:hypothetical protein